MKNFGTHLHGAQEVPARETHAQGQATFQANEDGTELRYKLNVANIANVFQAHIHLGPSGANGPIVVWLYPSTAPASVGPRPNRAVTRPAGRAPATPPMLLRETMSPSVAGVTARSRVT